MPVRAGSRAWSQDLTGRPPPKGTAPDSTSAVSSPSDPATAGNDTGAPRATATDGEGEPHSRHQDARLGSTDKELKSRATAADSVRTASGTPRQRGPRAEVMDAGLWGLGGEGP